MRKKYLGWILAVVIVAVNYSSPVSALRDMPATLYMVEGQTHLVDLPLPLKVDLEGDSVVASSSDGERLESVGGVLLSSQKSGDTAMLLSLFGLPVKQVDVRVTPQRMLIPGGEAIGVALSTQGVLVVGAANVGDAESPAKTSGLLSGDIIEQINGVNVRDHKHLSELVSKENGKPVVLTVSRKGYRALISVTPRRDLDSIYRIGVWVRDSTAGVGTLSFYDPATGWFAALGHAITDVDTGENLNVREGEIRNAKIIDVRLGQRGEPGELKGTFDRSSNILGSILKNTEFGLYGRAPVPISSSLYPKGLPVAAQSAVIKGPATLLVTLDGEGPKAYDCEIVNIKPQDMPAQRCMIVKITDERLLERTGGIVQGMSGSPLIQNGCLIGAITHVYVNDPTQGYAIFIEWMLDQIDKGEATAMRAAILCA